MMDEPVEVFSLVGTKQVTLSLRCLGSLLRFSVDPIQLTLIDDGTLNEDDLEQLVSRLPGVKVLPRKETEPRVQEFLRHSPSAAAFRGRNVLARKIFDLAAVASGDFAYCDSDVVFFRPVAGLFSWPSYRSDGLFMRDHQDAYALKLWKTVRHGNIRLAHCLNTGLFYYRKRSFDLEFVEWLLKQGMIYEEASWAEQTCWAALAGRSSFSFWAPEHVCVYRPGARPELDVKAYHFVSPVRRFMERFCDELKHAPEHHGPAGRVRIVEGDTVAGSVLAMRLIMTFARTYVQMSARRLLE